MQRLRQATGTIALATALTFGGGTGNAHAAQLVVRDAHAHILKMELRDASANKETKKGSDGDGIWWGIATGVGVAFALGVGLASAVFMGKREGNSLPHFN